MISTKIYAPVRRLTKFKFRKDAEFFEQRMVKHPDRSEFHSYPEYLYAALLESDSDVRAYVPQPTELPVGHRAYWPDFYVEHLEGRKLIELKPRGEFDEKRQKLIERAASLYGMGFEVVDNAWALERKTLAENWHVVVRLLARFEFLETPREEEIALAALSGGERSFGDLIDSGDRPRSFLLELATFRLLHSGKISADLQHQPLCLSTAFWS